MGRNCFATITTMEAIRSKIPLFQIKNVNLGLGATAILFLVIEIICMATHGWVVDYAGCDYSLKDAECGSANFDLTGDAKTAADAMGGLGSMAILCWILNLTINCLIFFAPCGMTKWFKIMTIAGLISCAVSWFFLTCAWGTYSDKKGGVDGSPDYGASFAFTILIWLALWPYAFFWVVLWNQVASNNDEHQPQVDNDGQPTSTAYPAATGTAHTDHKPHSGGVQSTGEPAPRPMVQHTDPAAHDDTKTEPPVAPTSEHHEEHHKEDHHKEEHHEAEAAHTPAL